MWVKTVEYLKKLWNFTWFYIRQSKSNPSKLLFSYMLHYFDPPENVYYSKRAYRPINKHIYTFDNPFISRYTNQNSSIIKEYVETHVENRKSHKFKPPPPPHKNLLMQDLLLGGIHQDYPPKPILYVTRATLYVEK